jgi:hypothetical protein
VGVACRQRIEAQTQASYLRVNAPDISVEVGVLDEVGYKDRSFVSTLLLELKL